MAELIRTWLPKASTRRGGGDLVAKASNEFGNSPIRALAAMLPGKNAPKPEARPEEDLMALAETETEEVATDTAEATGVSEEGDAEAEARVEQAYAEPIPARMADIDPINTASVPKEGWSIQVASSPSEVEARALLDPDDEEGG